MVKKNYKRKANTKRPVRARAAPRRKRTYRRGRKGLSTSREKTVMMSDRKFVKLPYVTLTTAVPFGSTSQYTPQTSNGRGMLPISLASTVGSDTPTDMFVFCTSWDASTTVLNSARLLPGNTCCLQVSNSSAVTAFLFSDAYKQIQPTGFAQWAPFYSKYLCHGSSVEVTMADCTLPGQLIVLPLCGPTGINANPNSAGTNYNFQGATSAPLLNRSTNINLQNILQGKCVPDDQPHCKIKFVSSTGGADRVRIKHHMRTKQLFDVKIYEMMF